MQPELVDEPVGLGAVFDDERVPAEQELRGDGRPERVRDGVLVRLVVEHPPGAVLAGFDLLVVVHPPVHLEREAADGFADLLDGREDGGDAEGFLLGDAFAAVGAIAEQRIEERVGGVRQRGAVFGLHLVDAGAAEPVEDSH